MPPGRAYAFGPFHLDPRGGRLLRSGVVVQMPARHLHLLQLLVSRPNELVTKNQLATAAWPDDAATDNRVAQTMFKIRNIVNADHSGCEIATERGFGYRFVGSVETIDIKLTDSDLDALLAPYRGFTEGRAALESLSRSRIADARRTFTQLLTRHATDPRVHVGLANACVLTFEATRADASPDAEALRLAAHHAREACLLDPKYGEAFATLGFVLERIGERDQALGALRYAVTLEPLNWRHQLRLAYATWGEERLQTSYRVLELLPGCPMAHLLAATVFVARDALILAEREVDAGLARLAAEPDGSAGFTAVALHWLKGLLLLARDQRDEAVASFERELALESRGHLYARECCANAWYAIGVCRWRDGETEAARAAFEQALTRVPRHPMAHAARALMASSVPAVRLKPDTTSDTTPDPTSDTTATLSVDEAMARAALAANTGHGEGAGQMVARALSAAPGGNAGWLLPIEPLLQVNRTRGWRAPALAALSVRAS